MTLARKVAVTLGIGGPFLLAIVYFVLTAADQGGPSAHLRKITDDARARTVPPAGVLVSRSEIVMGRSRAETSWSVDPAMEWSEYARWLRSALREYRTEDRGGAVFFWRNDPGDTYTLLAQPTTGTAHPRVEFRFSAGAD